MKVLKDRGWLIDSFSIHSFDFLTSIGVQSNIVLESKNGAIDADIYIFAVDTSHSNKKYLRNALLYTQSDNGSVKNEVGESFSCLSLMIHVC